MSDTPELENVRKGFKELLESATAPNTILSYALGAASACWNDLGNAGEFRTDLIEVIMEETSKRLGFTSDHNKTAVDEPNMRQVYIFDEKIVDRGTMFAKTPRPFKVHYHKASGACTALCQVIEEGE